MHHLAGAEIDYLDGAVQCGTVLFQPVIQRQFGKVLISSR
jgi:hypothetical protein